MKTTRSTASSAAIIRSRHPFAIGRACAILGLSLALALPAAATPFRVFNLVTDDQIGQRRADHRSEPANAWGISHSGTSPFWVSSNGGGISTLYRVNPLTNATTQGGPGGDDPRRRQCDRAGVQHRRATGNFNGDAFLFVSEDGTISGWRNALGTNAEVLQLASDTNSYKGSAISLISGNAYLYSADFKGAQIDVLKGNAAAPDLAGSFTDPGIPNGFAPFNIQNLGDTLYVTYA